MFDIKKEKLINGLIPVSIQNTKNISKNFFVILRKKPYLIHPDFINIFVLNLPIIYISHFFRYIFINPYYSHSKKIISLCL